MKTKITSLIGALFILSVAGCGKSAPGDDASAASPSAAQTPGSVAGKTTVKNAPDPSAAPGAGYRIQPSDPNDPKFKADPRLAGGG